MANMNKELVLLILQFLKEEGKYKDTIHQLERESGMIFNMRYFEECVANGEWDEVEKYLSGFTKVDDNRYSMKIFFEIRKQKYLEALDRHDYSKAVEILVKDLKVFATFNDVLFKEITMLMTLNNFRENDQLSKYGDTKSARNVMLTELKKLIEANPLFREKLQFPSFSNARLRTLINHSLNWQHQMCKHPKSQPDVKTLFVDHNCGQPSNASLSVANHLVGPISNVGGFPPLGVCGPYQPAPAHLNGPSAGWMTNPSSVVHPQAVSGPFGLTAAANTGSMIKRPRTPPVNNLALDYQTTDSDSVLKRSRLFSISDEGNNNVPVNILPYPSQSQAHTSYSADDLPKILVTNLTQGSTVRSMDFHPVQQSLLLVGTNIADIAIWEVASKDRLVYRNFKVWDLGTCSVTLQSSLATEYTASVNRVLWSSDGTLLAVAYSKHLVHIYSFHGGSDLRNLLELDAHTGNVSDLAFSRLNKQLSIITCGEDKTIKVWDAVKGSKLHTFEGHEACVYCVCPHQKENIQFVFSTAIDGKIKAWLYDNMGSRVDYDAPGRSCTTMSYTADGSRLFSCGTNKEGESFLVEWNESEGTVKRAYHGLGKRSVGVVQFDTTKSKFLAVGDEFLIKFWDMENPILLTTSDAEGGLPASPCIRFNRDGTLLAVSTSDNGIKVLANADGVRFLHATESQADAYKGASGSGQKSADCRSLPDVKVRPDDLERCKVWKPSEIIEPGQLRCLRLPDHTLSVRIMRLVYTNAGNAVLALTGNAVHKFWKWMRNERNAAGKASASMVPVLWQPSSGMLMTNEIGEANLEEAVPCFALSKNDSYVMSTSGGKVSLFNLMTFKTMTACIPPPPAATSLAFQPDDNNIIAIGLADSNIQIYNVRLDEVKTKLKGHQKKVTGLAFSNLLNILVSSGADSQMCVWSTDGWEMQACKSLKMPKGRVPNPQAQTRLQFHMDQIHLLVVHESQISVYEAPKLDGLKQWFPPQESSGAIADATYSCNSESIYVCLEDGSLAVLTGAMLTLRCLINPAAYIPLNPSTRVFPVAVASHPSSPNQFAVGLSDGAVHVLEPPEQEEKWGTNPPGESVAGPCISSAATAAASDHQPSR
ncbi:Topless- protein 4 [Dionaea muscipula]